MSTLIKSLVQRNMVGGVGNHALISLESAAIESHGDVEKDLAELHEVSADTAGAVEDSSKAALLSSGLDNLIDQTIDAYKGGEVDERGAELLELSIECLIKASGLPLHVRAVVPAFESAKCANYSTEAEAKKAGVVARLMAFLRDGWLRMVAAAKRFISGLRGTSASLEKYVAAVQARSVHMTEGSGGKLKVNGKIIQAMAGKRPAAAITAGLTEYTKFSMQVNMDLGGVASIKPLASRSDAEADGKWLVAQQEGLGAAIHNGLPKLKSFEFLPGHTFSVTHGTGVGPMVGADAAVTVAPAPASAEVAGLSSAEVKATLHAATEAISHLKEMSNSVNGWISASERAIPKLSAGIAHLEKAPQEDDVPSVMASMKALLAANVIYAKAYTLTLPHVLSMIHSNVAFADHSIGKISHDPAAAASKPAAAAAAN